MFRSILIHASALLVICGVAAPALSRGQSATNGRSLGAEAASAPTLLTEQGDSTLDVSITSTAGDVEERPNGNVLISQRPLDLVTENGVRQTVGLRFTGVDVPGGMTMTNAYVQFQTRTATSTPVNLTVRGEASDNASPFTAAAFNVSTRPRTSASVPWAAPPWTVVGEAGVNQRTPDLSAVLQEIFDRPGWTSGNALALIITGTGRRVAESFDAGRPPILHIETSSTPPAPDCADGVDNDGDGLTDFPDDAGCADANDNDEANPPPNTPPTAANRSPKTTQDTPVAITLSATDPERCELTFSIVTPPANGTVTGPGGRPCTAGSPNSDTATVTYTPATGFTGSDSFTYKASDGSLDSNIATVTVTVKPTATVAPVVETPPMFRSGSLIDVADDPAIWVHPSDPASSLIIGTNKDASGGLHVYGVDGTERQFLQTGKTNNVDLRAGFNLGAATVDLVGATNKTTNAIDFFTVNPTTLLLEGAGTIATSTPGINGFCMYRSTVTGRFFAIANFASGIVEQYELSGEGGSVTGTQVRRFDVGTMTEGCAADDDVGHLYVSEEDQGVWKYGAEPSAGTTRTQVDQTGTGGHLVADAEGIAILRSGGGGYLVVSSQGDSTLAVYTRGGANTYLGSFRVGEGNGIDATTSTDGIEVTSAALGSSFPGGLLVAHDHVNSGGTTSNLKYVRWVDVEAALGLGGTT
jgi:myo-inositol-hexaphosphate 3-phosphohydrolase